MSIKLINYHPYKVFFYSLFILILYNHVQWNRPNDTQRFWYLWLCDEEPLSHEEGPEPGSIPEGVESIKGTKNQLSTKDNVIEPTRKANPEILLHEQQRDIEVKKM